MPITIGRDYGSTVEVISGLKPTDQVIVNPSDSLTTGTPVRYESMPQKPEIRNESKADSVSVRQS